MQKKHHKKNADLVFKKKAQGKNVSSSSACFETKTAQP